MLSPRIVKLIQQQIAPLLWVITNKGWSRHRGRISARISNSVSGTYLVGRIFVEISIVKRGFNLTILWSTSREVLAWSELYKRSRYYTVVPDYFTNNWEHVGKWKSIKFVSKIRKICFENPQNSFRKSAKFILPWWIRMTEWRAREETKAITTLTAPQKNAPLRKHYFFY